MTGLTEIEKRYASCMISCTGTSSGIDQPDPAWWPAAVRKSMRRTAYHEAGHFAARCFTGLEISHVVGISIIGNEIIAGYLRSERAFAEHSLESYPPPLQRSNGRMLLLANLAGSGAEMILDQSEEWESIFDYWELSDGNNEEGSDFFRVFRIAEIMAKPFMPGSRILKLADKWTLEMLRMPAVWNAVETVACKLIKQGELVADELHDMIYDSDFPKIYHLPKWRRRISFTQMELERYTERI